MIFDTYMSRLSLTRKSNALYLRPKSNYAQDWYIDAPVGINRLQSAVRELCREAGFSGYFTNHSLRATAATRMYNNGVEEQMIIVPSNDEKIQWPTSRFENVADFCHFVT